LLIYKKYFFDAAHYMENYKKDHEYSKIHGHSYEVIISVDGSLEEKIGWVMNFDDLDKLVQPLLEILDHSVLNEVEGLKNPTSENLARWFWFKLKKNLNSVKSVEINRPRIGGCIFSGD